MNKKFYQIFKRKNKEQDYNKIPEETRMQIIERSCKQVSRGVFFSTVIIITSFLPVFLLTGQEGKLFHPLAYTKTFIMAVDALLVITLAPVLISFFMKGKFQDDKKNPVNRGIERVYEPVIRWCIKWRKTVIGINIAALLISIPLVMNLGENLCLRWMKVLYFLCPSLFPMYPILKRKEFCRCRIKSSNLFLKYSTCLAKRVEQILQQIIRQ